jgi:hypothetical protein
LEQTHITKIFFENLGAFPALFFKAPETGLSAPIFFAGDGKKVFPLQSPPDNARKPVSVSRR